MAATVTFRVAEDDVIRIELIASFLRRQSPQIGAVGRSDAIRYALFATAELLDESGELYSEQTPATATATTSGGIAADESGSGPTPVTPADDRATAAGYYAAMSRAATERTAVEQGSD